MNDLIHLELKIPPVVQLLAVALGMWLIGALWPSARLDLPFRLIVCLILLIAGLVVAIAAIFEFRAAQTTVDPRVPDRSTHLVTSGIYRFSRNPMYLGMVLMLAGWGWYIANGFAFLLIPLFMLYMVRFQIQPEERWMKTTFGDQYLTYAAQVRRWI